MPLADGFIIAMPKFTTRVKTDLVPALQDLGVDDLFEAADLSGISATADLTVTGAFHETFFALDENGVEAAAATAIVVGEASLPPPPVTVVLDEPFLFILRDTATNTPLFVGSIASPGVGD
jgi:serpin B